MQDRRSAAYRARWCQSRRSSTSRVRAVPAVSRRTACERSRSSSSASNVLMSSDCVATRRARISLRRRASETRTVTARLAAMQSLLGKRSVEGLARIADIDPEVPPCVALEQAAQLVPSELEVVDEYHWPAVVADRVDLPSERAGEQLEAAGAWMPHHVAAREPGPEALAHLAQGGSPSLAGRTKRSPAQAPSRRSTASRNCPSRYTRSRNVRTVPAASRYSSIIDPSSSMARRHSMPAGRRLRARRMAPDLHREPAGSVSDGVDHQLQPTGCGAIDPGAVVSRIGRPSERNMRATRLKRRDRVTRVLTPPLPGPTFRAAVRDVLDDYRMNRKRSLRDVERHVRLHLGPV